jgi:hypothetical protein
MPNMELILQTGKYIITALITSVTNGDTDYIMTLDNTLLTATEAMTINRNSNYCMVITLTLNSQQTLRAKWKAIGGGSRTVNFRTINVVKII